MWEATHTGKPGKFAILSARKLTVSPRFKIVHMRYLCMNMSVTGTKFSPERWADAVTSKLRSCTMVGKSSPCW